MRILGIDLAWGDRRSDGVALIEVGGNGQGTLAAADCSRGDDSLITWVREASGDGPCLVALDGPIVCPNRSGGRPVDRETHRLFGRAHAGCHPANLSRCPRPARICHRLKALGFSADYRLDVPRQRCEADRPLRRQIEVYPHPAAVTLFGLPRILKYKRGPVGARRRELARLQGLLSGTLTRLVPPLGMGPQAQTIFAVDPVSLVGAAHKAHEDALDAVICAVVGWLHWVHGGQQSQVLGDLATGFLVVPLATCVGRTHGGSRPGGAAIPG
jgi:predicted RNase H-like nuclease